MFVYVVTNGINGHFKRVFSTPELASEYRDSVHVMLPRMEITIFQVKVDSLDHGRVWFADDGSLDRVEVSE